MGHPLALPALGKGILSHVKRNPFGYLFSPRVQEFYKASKMVPMAMAEGEGL
jgi:hypothetical protein